MGINKLNFNPLCPPFDLGVDLTGNFDWSGTHSWGTSAGVAGFANFYADQAGKGLVWDGDATPGNACLTLTGKNNTDKHFAISVGLTTKPSGGGFFSPVTVAATVSYTGAPMIMVAQQFDMTDSRTVNATGTDFLRAFSMNVARSSSYSTSQNVSAGIEPVYTLMSDSGSYSNSAGAGWSMIANKLDVTVTPTIALSSAKSYPVKAWNFNTITLGPTGTGLTNFTADFDVFDFGTSSLLCSSFFGAGAIDFTGINQKMSFTNFSGTLNIQFIDYNPTVSSPTTHYFAKIMKGRTWIGADGTDSAAAWDGQLCFGAGIDSAIYDDGTYLCFATDFQGAGGRGLHLVDQVYTATPVANTGYVTIRVAGVNYKFMVAT